MVAIEAEHMQFQSYNPSDADEWISFWNSNLENEFPMDSKLWVQNLHEDPHFQPENSTAALDNGKVCGIILIKAPNDLPQWNGQNMDAGFISALVCKPGEYKTIGKELLEAALKCLKAQGKSKIFYGSDSSHFFPGVPTQNDELKQLLKEIGFSISAPSAHDVYRNISNFELPKNLAESVVRPCTTNDIPKLISFLEREFPGRWLSNTRSRLKIEDTPEEIMLLHYNNEVHGFAHTFSNKSKFIGPPIYWRKRLGANYGGLGPMGVSASVRGRGLGLALLAYSVQNMKDRGVGNSAIDWTGLVDFYGLVGYQIWNSYCSASMVL